MGSSHRRTPSVLEFNSIRKCKNDCHPCRSYSRSTAEDVPGSGIGPSRRGISEQYRPAFCLPIAMDMYSSDLRQLICQSRTGSVPSTTPDDTTISNTVIIDDEEDEEMRAEDVYIGFHTQFHPWAFYLGLFLFKFTQQHQDQSLTVMLDSISAANLLESAQLVGGMKVYSK